MNGRTISGPLIPGHPSAPVICGVRRLPLKETNVIAVRPLRGTDDRAALLALDTSFTTDRIFRLERTDNGVTLDKVAAEPPIYKSYSLAGATDVIAGHDWVQVAEYDDGFAGVASMTIETWNRRAVLEHLYVKREARRIGGGGGLGTAGMGGAQGWDGRCGGGGENADNLRGG